jgi:argininosuccinate lyase
VPCRAIALAWDTFRECRDCLKLATPMVDAAQPNRARMLSLTERNFSTATDLADAMVRESGLSFRDAHHVVGGVVRMAMDAGLAANEINSAMVDQAAREVIGRPLGMPAATVASCLDPTAAVAARRTVGGPSPGEVRRRAGVLGKALAAARGLPRRSGAAGWRGPNSVYRRRCASWRDTIGEASAGDSPALR